MAARVGLSDDGTTVVVPRGETLDVMLPQNASTGYRWEIHPSDGQVIVDDRVLSPSSEHPGATGHRLFTVRIDQPGVVLAHLRRSWEPVEAAVQTYTVRVQAG
jgi:predicted secreted protein